MEGYLTTKEMLKATRMSLSTFNRMKARYPDQIIPGARVCQAYLWPREMIAVLLALRLRDRQAK